MCLFYPEGHLHILSLAIVGSEVLSDRERKDGLGVGKDWILSTACMMDFTAEENEWSQYSTVWNPFHF